MSDVTNKFLSIMKGGSNKFNDRGSKETMSQAISNDMTKTLAQPINVFDKTIRAVNDGKEGYTSLDLMDKTQTINGINYPMGDIIIKAKPNGSDKSELLFVKENESLETKVYVGNDGNSKQAFVSTQDSDGKESIVELEEFHSLTMKTGDTKLGILTCYDSKIGLNTGIIKGEPNLNAITQLFLSDSIILTDSEQTKLLCGDNNDE